MAQATVTYTIKPFPNNRWAVWETSNIVGFPICTAVFNNEADATAFVSKR